MEQIMQRIEKPTLLLDVRKTQRNIDRMVEKATRSGVLFRPHFKTHQSAEIGEWFRKRGTKAITVSSVDMAEYFINHGWSDVTLAFPVNPRQVDRINQLNRQARLNVLVESLEVIKLLDEQTEEEELHVWMKVDSGYHRTGIPWDDSATLVALGKAIARSTNLLLDGILTHAGHTYGAGSREVIRSVHQQVMERMAHSQRVLTDAGIRAAISIGDTPSCSTVEEFKGADEIRPGNFVFYDLSQLRFGSCQVDDIAVAVACPVVAKHSDRSEIVIYGGAIHFSKEFLPAAGDSRNYGQVARQEEDGWGGLEADCLVTSLSQEHGIVRASDTLLSRTAVGGILLVLPVHSCLTANLLRRYLTLDGQWIDMADI